MTIRSPSLDAIDINPPCRAQRGHFYRVKTGHFYCRSTEIAPRNESPPVVVAASAASRNRLRPRSDNRNPSSMAACIHALDCSVTSRRPYGPTDGEANRCAFETGSGRARQATLAKTAEKLPNSFNSSRGNGPIRLQLRRFRCRQFGGPRKKILVDYRRPVRSRR